MRTLHNQNGQSLVQALISIAITGVMMLIFTTMSNNQQKEMLALSQKLGSSDLEKQLIESLKDGSVCTYILNHPTELTFDSTAVSPSSPQVLSPAEPIYASVKTGPPLIKGPVVAQAGRQASPYSQSLIVNEIKLKITGAPTPTPAPGPGATYSGYWEISYDSSKLIRPLSPATVATTLTVDTSVPTEAKITACRNENPASPSPTIPTLNLTYIACGKGSSCDVGPWDPQAVYTQCPAGYTATGCSPLCYGWDAIRYCQAQAWSNGCAAMCQRAFDGAPCYYVAVYGICIKNF